MRVIELLLAIAVAVVVSYGTYLVAAAVADRRGRALRRRARWRVTHYGERGETVVAVSLTMPDGRVLDSHTVDRFEDAQPDWTDRFLRAKDRAEERAFHLNDGGSELTL